SRPSSRPTSSWGVANGRMPEGGGRGSRGGIDGGVGIAAGAGAAGGSVVAGGGVWAETAGGSAPRVRTSARDRAKRSHIMPDLPETSREAWTSHRASYSGTRARSRFSRSWPGREAHGGNLRGEVNSAQL